MTTIRDRASENARHAWEVADFPLIPEDSDSKFVSVSAEPHGREGLLPVSLFKPRRYNLGDPSAALNAIKIAWELNPHVGGVLEANLGDHGRRLGSHVLSELVIIAADQHRARTAFTAARIIVGKDVQQETLVSLWDNGLQYGSEEAITDGFKEGEFWRYAGTRPKEISDSTPGWPHLVVRNATAALGGTLTVMSGANRVDITHSDDQYVYTPIETEPIVGNLVIARVPHIEQAIS
jgi:hypothetical protein